jgi:N-ethylmaleimide reductase
MTFHLKTDKKLFQFHIIYIGMNRGLMFLQLWHVGRISHVDLQPGGVLPVSASAIRPLGSALTRDGLKPHPTPRALRPDEITAVIEEYRRGAQLSMQAGFDGVEVHGANGYLPDQFLNTGSNQRTDEWAGSVTNRARFLLAVTDAVIDVWGADRVGVRISPANHHGDIDDANRWETYSYAVRELNKRNVAYLHLVSPRVDGAEDAKTKMDLAPERFRPLITESTRLIVAGGYKPADAESLLDRGIADAVAFGRFHSPLRKELQVACTEHPSIIRQPWVRTSLFPKLPRCLACILPNFQCIRSRVRQHKLARWHLAIGGGRIQH